MNGSEPGAVSAGPVAAAVKPRSPAPDRDVRRPQLAPPPGSCDCHVHIIGPQAVYPLTEQTPLILEDSPLDEFRRVQSILGVTRALIVASGGHGYSYQHVLNVLCQDPVNYRGVVMLPPDITDTELAILDKAGVVGARFYPGVSAPDGRTLARVKEIGWFAEFAIANSQFLDAWTPEIDAFDGCVVIEHSGMPPVEQGVDSPHFRKILHYVDTGRAWVKLSHRFAKSELPPYPDSLPFIHKLVAHAPERMLYGSDYPHPQFWTPMPNEAMFLDLMLEWVPDAHIRHQILVRNPEALLGFPAIEAR